MRDAIPGLTASSPPSPARLPKPAEGPPDDAFAAVLGSVRDAGPPTRHATTARTASAEGRKREDDSSASSTQTSAATDKPPNGEADKSAAKPDAPAAGDADTAATAATTTAAAEAAATSATAQATAAQGGTPAQAGAAVQQVSAPAASAAADAPAAAAQGEAQAGAPQTAGKTAGSDAKDAATSPGAAVPAPAKQTQAGRAGTDTRKGKDGGRQPAARAQGTTAQPARQATGATRTAAAAAPTAASPSGEPAAAATPQAASSASQAATDQQQPPAVVVAGTDGSARGAGTAAPKGTAEPAPLQAHARMQDIVDVTRATMRMATRGGATQARITMHPDDLGEVQVRLTYHDGGISASVTADSSAAARALSQATHDLRRSLESQGLTVFGLDVQLSGGDSGSQTGSDRGLDLASAMAPQGTDGDAVETDETPIEPARLTLAGSAVDVLA